MSYYSGFTLAFLLAAAEAAVLPFFRVDGLQPNLVLVLLVAWLCVRGGHEAFVLLAAGGVFLGLVDGAPLGVALLGLSPLVLLNEVSGSHLRQGGLLLAILFVIVMTVAYHAAFLSVDTAAGQAGSWAEALRRVVLPTALLNVAVLLPVYLLVSLFSQERRRAAYA